MPMRFRYKHIRMGRVVYSLGGRTVRPRPLLDIAVVGPSATRLIPALVDTGADDTVFPETLSSAIGVNLAAAHAGIVIVPGAGIVPLR